MKKKSSPRIDLTCRGDSKVGTSGEIKRSILGVALFSFFFIRDHFEFRRKTGDECEPEVKLALFT